MYIYIEYIYPFFYARHSFAHGERVSKGEKGEGETSRRQSWSSYFYPCASNVYKYIFKRTNILKYKVKSYPYMYNIFVCIYIWINHCGYIFMMFNHP